MVQKNVKKLTPAVIKKADKKLDERKEIKVTMDGEEFKLEHDIVFRKTKHQNIVRGMIDFLSFGSDKEGYVDYASAYTSLLILKEYTSLDVPDGVEEGVLFLKVLVDTGLLSDIITQLPEDQITSVFEAVEIAVNELTERILELEDEREGLESELENEELLNLQIEKTEDAEVEAEVEEDLAKDEE